MGPIPYGSVHRGPTFPAPSQPRPFSPSPSASSSPPPPALRYLILAFGSRVLRFGTADDFSPQQKAMAIAYRTPSPTSPPPTPSSSPDNDPAWRESARASYARLLPDVAKRRVKPPPKPKFFDEFDAVPVYEEGGPTTTVDLPVDDTPWTDVSASPSYITGDAALNLHPSAPYRLFFPLQAGHFNVSAAPTPSPSPYPPFDAPNASYTAVLSAIESILYDTLTVDLRIPPASFSHYSVVVSLPGTWAYREVYDVVGLLFDRLRVKEVFVHHEAVLAAYGSGLASACVVDVGPSLTRVCCVEEGMVVVGSEVVGEYGGDDLGELLFEWMKAHDHYFPCPHLSPRASYATWAQVQRAKEKTLTCSMRDYHYQWVELRELTLAGGVRVHRMNVSSAAVLVPRALFDPSLLRGDRRGGGEWMPGVVVDPLMDDIIRGSVFYAFTRDYDQRPTRPRRDVWEQVRRQAEAQEAAGQAGPKEGDVVGEEKKEGVVEKVDGRRRKRKPADPTLLAPPLPRDPTANGGGGAAAALGVGEALPSLSQMIAASINAVGQVAARRRLCLSILLTGATCRMPHLQDYATTVLAQTLPPLMETTLTGGRGAGEEVQCVMGQKLVDVGCEAWKGAAVIAGIRLEALGTGGRDRWMTREEWQRSPTRALRERAPFPV